MEGDELYNFLFEQKINEGLFNMNDEELSVQKHKAKESQKKLMAFINTILKPEDREKLEILLETRDNDYKDFFFLEERLFYRNGFKDGISIIVPAIVNN